MIKYLTVRARILLVIGNYHHRVGRLYLWISRWANSQGVKRNRKQRTHIKTAGYYIDRAKERMHDVS